MSKKYILAVDGGSQSSKILIFDLEGNIVCEDKEPLKPYHLPEPGIVEHPDDDLWDSICIASKKTMAKFQGDPNDIIAIGLCTIRFCRALLKKDGSLYSPVMSWMDQRVSRKHEQVSDEIAYVTTSSGYITHRFTGEFNDTAANYAGVWPLDSDTWDWLPDDQIAEYNLSRDMLFNLKMPGDILGYVTKEAAEATGLPEGLPVVATSNDKAVEALGAGCVGEHTAVISLGTYIAGMVQGHMNYKDAQKFWTNYASEPMKYLYESNGIRRGMWMVSWFKNVLGESYEELAKSKGYSCAEEMMSAEAEQVPAGSDGLMTVLDWLAPADQPYKKGIMIGFDGRHGRAHMYRSILEAIALTMRNHVADMCQEMRITLDRLIISGGGSNSELFMQIFADVFDLPTSRNVVNGAAAVGAAICAAVAVGAYPDFETAAAHMVKIRDEFTPNPKNTDIYMQMNEVYYDMSRRTDPILKESYKIFS